MMIVSFPSLFWLLKSFGRKTINSNGSAPEETFARAYRTHRRFSCHGLSRVAKTRWRRRENAATVPPVVSAVGAVYRVVICERERDTRWLWLLCCSRAWSGKMSCGNQWRSEPAPVNEPRRFFNIVTVTIKASRLYFCVRETTKGEKRSLMFPPLSIISDPLGGKFWAENGWKCPLNINVDLFWW